MKTSSGFTSFSHCIRDVFFFVLDDKRAGMLDDLRAGVLDGVWASVLDVRADLFIVSRSTEPFCN